VPSKYFDTALALAYQSKQDLALSYCLSYDKVSFVDQNPNPADKCWVRLRTAAEEQEAMTSVLDGDRAKYFWGALRLMECTRNTWLVVHSEAVNVLIEIFAAWFVSRNESGQFIGNKLSLLRLSGTRIKPLGFPSWLNSAVNENDADGFDLLDVKNVGYMATISDETAQDCYVSSARSINGTPVIATMISKFVDYQCRQASARMLTATGTATAPVLTDEKAYAKIQEIVSSNLNLFAGTNGRITAVRLAFPAFDVAKSGRTAIKAASAWSALYKDDLDSITVTGGITAM
jgi:hypothetical protein